MNGERPLADQDFAALFTSFQRSAFRLETLSEYRVPPSVSEFVHQFPVLIPSHLDG